VRNLLHNCRLRLLRVIADTLGLSYCCFHSPLSIEKQQVVLGRATNLLFLSAIGPTCSGFPLVRFDRRARTGLLPTHRSSISDGLPSSNAKWFRFIVESMIYLKAVSAIFIASSRFASPLRIRLGRGRHKSTNLVRSTASSIWQELSSCSYALNILSMVGPEICDVFVPSRIQNRSKQFKTNQNISKMESIWRQGVKS